MPHSKSLFLVLPAVKCLICEKQANIWIEIELLQAIHQLELLTEEHVGGICLWQEE